MNGLVDHQAAYSAEEPALPTTSDPRLRTRGMKRAAKELLSRVFTYAKPSTANTSAPMKIHDQVGHGVVNTDVEVAAGNRDRPRPKRA